MRAGGRACAVVGSLGALFAFACNAVLGNQPGSLIDAGGGDALAPAEAAPSSLPSPEAAPPADSGAPDGTPPADSGPPDGAAPPAFSPSDLGVTVVLWLRGDRGVTTVPCDAGACVTRWADQSGWSNDAFPPDGAVPPVLSTAQDAAAVTFVDPDGGDKSTSLVVADTTSLQFKTAFTLTAVATNRASAAPHTAVLFSKQTPVMPFPGPGFFVNCSNTQLTSATGQTCAQVDIDQFVASSELGLFDGVIRAYVAVYDGATLSLGVNAEPWVTRSVSESSPIGAAGTPAHIGGVLGSRQTLTGDIVELIALDQAISPGRWSDVYGYFRARYGLP